MAFHSYAVPPVGPLRFRAPEPGVAVAGVKGCHRYTACAPQHRVYTMTGVGKYQPMSEDCLTLNVVTPEVGRPRTRRTVAGDVLHPRGGYILGSSATQLYDGAALARRGCVYVSVNYRLGALGCLDLSSLHPQTPIDSNLFLRDIVLALSWVKKNIAAFGGDPDNVTIFGEAQVPRRGHPAGRSVRLKAFSTKRSRRARPPAWSAHRRWPPRSPTGSSPGWVWIAATPLPNCSSQARRSGRATHYVMTHSLDNIVGASAVGPTHGDDFLPWTRSRR